MSSENLVILYLTQFVHVPQSNHSVESEKPILQIRMYPSNKRDLEMDHN